MRIVTVTLRYHGGNEKPTGNRSGSDVSESVRGARCSARFPCMSDTSAADGLVVLKDVNKHFGDLHVLKDINLSIGEGEVVVVIGPSGSGKSTLCRAINRLEPIDSGTIMLDGKALPTEGKGMARLRADVGMVFQSFNLFAHKTILQNVTLGPLRARGTPKAKAEA